MHIKLIENKIYFLRGRKVMMDSDLADLYAVETKNLNKAVKRNIERFPKDFMFQLTFEETELMRFQFGTAYQEHGLNKGKSSRFQNGTSRSVIRSQSVTASKRNTRFLPYVFTEQGVAMLSSVLRSKQAILVNIQIMRTFTKIREMLASNKELREKIEKLERKYDQQFVEVFTAIKLLLSPPEEPKKKIGFEVKE